MPINPYSLFPPEKKTGRKPIKKKGSVRTELRLQQKGRCWRCHRGFDSMGVATPHIHHKNGRNSDNRMSNLALVCPNCHNVLSHRQTLKRRKGKPQQPFSIGLKPIKIDRFI